MTKRTSRSMVLAALAGLLAVAGCGSSDPAPKALPPVHSASPSPSTTASPTTVEAQVEAAVRHYFDVATVAANTGDTKALEALSTPGCGCRELVRAIQATYAHGKSSGVRFDVQSVQIHDAKAQVAAATVVLAVPAYRDLDLNGNVLRTYKPGTTTEDLSLVLSRNQWIVTNGVRLGGTTK